MKLTKGLLMAASALVVVGGTSFLAGCASPHSSTYGIPQATWNKMSFEQRQQIIASRGKKHSRSSFSGSGYNSQGFVVEH